MSRLLTTARYEQLKSFGADLIEDYELVYPLEPHEIANALGIRVSIHEDGKLPTWQGCDTDDGYTEQVASRYGTKFHIHVNGDKPYFRQSYTLMHEIAHAWLDHFSDLNWPGEEAAEGEANFLANYLLAPDILVVTWEPEFTIHKIALTFQISEDAAKLTYERVMRARNRRAINQGYDTRILTSATRRLSRYDSSPTMEVKPA